jgi:DNA transposition AAA+ family ATPase
MTDQHKKQIQAALRKWIEAAQLSQNQAATQLGISAGYISKILAGEFSWKTADKEFKVSDEMWSRLRSQLKLENGSWQIFETRNYKAIHRLCDDARENRRMMAISAPTGLGKTCALDSYRMATPNTWYVLCDKLMNRKALLSDILRSMGIDTDGTSRALMQRICDRLNSVNGGLLILDDAGKLKPELLTLIQIIFDRTDGVSGSRSCGIVISGTDSLEDTVRTYARRNRHGMPELLRRIGFWQNLRKPGREEIKAIASGNGITNSDHMAWLTAQVKDFGSLRETCQNLHRLAGQSITPDLLSSIHIGSTAN